MKRNIFSIIAVLAVLATLLTACGGNPPSNSNNAADPTSQTSGTTSENSGTKLESKWKITIPGKSGSLCNTPTYVAYEKGFFAEEGIDAELISSNFETNKVGLANGTIATVNGDFQMFPSIEAGVQMSVVEGLHLGCIKLNVLPDSEIQTAEDLRGKVIAVDEIGGTPHQVALLWLAQNGLTASDVTFLPFDDGNLELEALQKEQVDVAAMWDPLASIAEKAGTVRAILDIGKDEPFAGHYCCFLYASNKLLESDPELIAAELRAYHKAQNWIHENPEEAVQLVTEQQYVSIEDHELAVELIASYGYPSTADYENKTYDVKADVEYFAQALYDAGFLTTDPAEYAQTAYAVVDLALGQ